MRPTDSIGPGKLHVKSEPTPIHGADTGWRGDGYLVRQQHRARSARRPDPAPGKEPAEFFERSTHPFARRVFAEVQGRGDGRERLAFEEA